MVKMLSKKERNMKKKKKKSEKKDLKTQYQGLIERIQNNYTEVNLENRTNCYICPTCGITKTKDIDKGVTPMVIMCPKCNKNFAKSTFYIDIDSSIPVTHEWYRPSLDEFLKLDRDMQEHVLKGGLDYRSRSE